MNEEDEATWPTHEEIFAQELSDEAAFAIYQLPPCVRIVVASNFQLEVAKNEQKIYKVI